LEGPGPTTPRSQELRASITVVDAAAAVAVLVVLVVGVRLLLLASAEDTGAAGGDEADLLSWHGVAGHGGGMADVLMVTTTVRMLHGVHGGTSDPRPAVALHLVLVVVVAGLQHGLVQSATAGDDADDRSAGGRDRLSGAGWEAHSGLLAIVGVTDDHAVAAGGAGQAASVGGLLLAHGDDGTLGHLADGEAVADFQAGLGSAVDELSGVRALNGHPELLVQAILVVVAEVDLAEGGAAAGVVHDLLDDALGVAVALGIVQNSELHGALAEAGLGGEDEGLALTGSSDNSAHGWEKKGWGGVLGS